MTAVELRERLDKMRATAGDPEADHGAEDQLRADVLRELAKSAVPEVAELAALALSTDDFIKERWYA